MKLVSFKKARQQISMVLLHCSHDACVDAAGSPSTGRDEGVSRAFDAAATITRVRRGKPITDHSGIRVLVSDTALAEHVVLG